MGYPDSVRLWLEDILKKRVCSDLRLSCNEEMWCISLDGTEQQLTVSIDFNMWIGCFSPSYSEWDCKQEGLSAPCGGMLPNIGGERTKRLWDDSKRHFSYDFLGFIWWMLSRKEEIDNPIHDKHGRFSATASHAYKHSYLMRPVVDEWIEILRQLVKRVWPSLPLVFKEYKINPTHDIDVPSYYSLGGMKKYFRTVAIDILRKKKYAQSLMSPLTVARYAFGQHGFDPFYTYDFLMGCSEAIGVKSTFYFKAGATNLAYDSPYNLAHPKMKKIIRQIIDRGHRVGLHPSFECYNNLQTLIGEVEKFRSVLKNLQVDSEFLYSRMHYLRLTWPDTFIKLCECGVTHDSSMGYADAAGFRCGTCHPYTAFDPVQMQVLPVTVSPLIFMEATMLTEDVSLSESAVERTSHELISACKAVSGDFVLLWHNSNLTDYKNCYQRLLENC